MFDDLEVYLGMVTNEYRAERILTALTRAYEIQGTVVLEVVDDKLMSSNGTPPDTVVFELAAIARDTLVAGIAVFGVTISPDADTEENLGMLSDLAQTLLVVDNYEDPYRLVALCDDATDINATLAEIVEEVTGQHADNILDLLDIVDAELINRIMIENTKKIMGMEALQDNPDELERRRAIVERIKSSEYYNRDGYVESRLVKTGLIAGEPLDILNTFDESIYDLRGDDMAIACYQMACASNVATNAVIGTAKLLLDKILGDDYAVERQTIAFKLNRYPIPSVEV